MDLTIKIHMHTQRERDIKAEELFLYLLIYKNSILIAEELLTYKQRGKRLKAEIKEQRKNAKKKPPSIASQQVYTEFQSISQCILKTNYSCLVARLFLPFFYERFVLHFHRSTQTILYNLI